MAWVRWENRCRAEKQFCRASLDFRLQLSHLHQPEWWQPPSGWPPAFQQVWQKKKKNTCSSCIDLIYFRKWLFSGLLSKASSNSAVPITTCHPNYLYTYTNLHPDVSSGFRRITTITYESFWRRRKGLCLSLFKLATKSWKRFCSGDKQVKPWEYHTSSHCVKCY